MAFGLSELRKAAPLAVTALCGCHVVSECVELSKSTSSGSRVHTFSAGKVPTPSCLPPMESLLQLKQALDAGLITAGDYDAGKHAFLRAQQVCSLCLSATCLCRPSDGRPVPRYAAASRAGC